MTDMLATTIKAIREKAGDSPAAAAQKIGVSRQGYMKWELGDTKNMKLGNLVTFCDAYHVGIDELIRGTLILDECHPTIANADLTQSPSRTAKLKIAYSGTPLSTALQANEMDADTKILIEGFKLADSSMQRAMLALARESVAAFEKRSEENS